ncbi:MAG: DeoR/GlpR family DNA-binding transcription regulator [Spirochaetaceae bacterium]
MNKRHEQILNIVSKEKEISVNSLSEILNVSLVTIRSDLRLLEEQNLLIRTHGGASLSPTDDISHRLSINYSLKQKIAYAAAEQVEEGETILLEAGSCVALMAQALATRKNINVITNNAFVARQMKDSKSINVILIGGIYQKESESMVGTMVPEYLSYYNFTKVFIGMDGFTKEHGAMCRDLDRSEVMSEFVKRGKKVYILSDSGKMGKTAVKTICKPEDINCIITDADVSAEYQDFLRENNVELIMT